MYTLNVLRFVCHLHLTKAGKPRGGLREQTFVLPRFWGLGVWQKRPGGSGSGWPSSEGLAAAGGRFQAGLLTWPLAGAFRPRRVPAPGVFSHVSWLPPG